MNKTVSFLIAVCLLMAFESCAQNSKQILQDFFKKISHDSINNNIKI